MSQRKTSSSNPNDWLLFAGADLEALRLLSANQTAFLMCQSKCAEALEKLIKAELISLGWPLIKTHDLQQLVDELGIRDSVHVDIIQPLAEALAECYVVGRYPGFDLSEHEDWETLVSQIEQISAYAASLKKAISAPGQPPH